MTPYERCLAALNWEKPDRVPVIPQNSDHAIHLAGYDMIEGSKDAKKLANALLEAREKFGYDGIMLGPDAAILAEALGCPTEYRTEDPPAITGHIIESYDDVEKLRIPDMQKDGRLKVWLDATEILLNKCKDIFIICRADQVAFSLAALLRGMENLSMDLTMGENVEGIQKLLDFCNQCHIEFARAIKAIGAHMTTCGDSYGGPELIGPKRYTQHVFPYEKEATGIIQYEIGLPYSIHICGNTDTIHDIWPDTDAAAFEVDHKTNIKSLRKASMGKNTIIGNLNTTMLCNDPPEMVTEACKELFDVMMPESGFILSSGCSMSANTKVENVEAMVEVAKEFGVY
jgi:MtaA/CmuA family methyltransferase